MNRDFTHTVLGNTGINVHRFGLSATYRPGKRAIFKAMDEGLNFFFCYGFDTNMIRVLREVSKKRRDNFVVATGAYNLYLPHPNLSRILEKRLRQLHTDYIDVFLFLGVMKERQFSEHVREELLRFREQGKVRAVGISTHNRKLAGKLAAEGVLDVIMARYNAAHRGAEQEIFPYLNHFNPGLVSYTATRWRHLLKRPRGWPKKELVPTAGMCYRFVLSNPHVHICLTAPSNMKQLDENLDAFRQGTLSEEEMEFMRRFGDVVHRKGKLFW